MEVFLNLNGERANQMILWRVDNIIAMRTTTQPFVWQLVFNTHPQQEENLHGNDGPPKRAMPPMNTTEVQYASVIVAIGHTTFRAVGCIIRVILHPGSIVDELPKKLSNVLDKSATQDYVSSSEVVKHALGRSIPPVVLAGTAPRVVHEMTRIPVVYTPFEPHWRASFN